MAGGPPDPYAGGPGPPMDMGFDDNMVPGGGPPPGGGDYGDPYPPIGPQSFPGDTSGMPDAGVGAGGQGAMPPAEGDIGPFVRPILNKLVRIFSALTSLVALILQFMILGQ